MLNKGGVLYYIFLHLFFFPTSVTFWRSLYVGESVSTTCVSAIPYLPDATSAKLKAFSVPSPRWRFGESPWTRRVPCASLSAGSISRNGCGAPLGVQGFPVWTWTCSSHHSMGLLGPPLPRFCALLKSSQGFSVKVVGTLPSLCLPQLPFRKALGRALLPDSHIIFSV